MRRIKYLSKSEELDMAGTLVKQPLPTQRIERLSPFLLLHHLGPTEAIPGMTPLDIAPHPHRGFEPVTFLYSGSIRHKDSLGNEGILKAGDVQWMTAGRGVIHSERASNELLYQGGTLEAIQLWVNLPKAFKMVPPKYQHLKSDQIPVVKKEGVSIKVVAGQFEDQKGPIQTHTPIMALQLNMKKDAFLTITTPQDFHTMAYVLSGNVRNIGDQPIESEFLAIFEDINEPVALQALSESRILLLSALPINEPVAQWGPYVMNTQTEVLQAMRDYQIGKMGVYID
jgi:redox-sensitive bicupin YhaK (pirin superfamily)